MYGGVSEGSVRSECFGGWVGRGRVDSLRLRTGWKRMKRKSGGWW